MIPLPMVNQVSAVKNRDVQVPFSGLDIYSGYWIVYAIGGWPGCGAPLPP